MAIIADCGCQGMILKQMLRRQVSNGGKGVMATEENEWE